MISRALETDLDSRYRTPGQFETQLAAVLCLDRKRPGATSPASGKRSLQRLLSPTAGVAKAAAVLAIGFIATCVMAQAEPLDVAAPDDARAGVSISRVVTEENYVIADVLARTTAIDTLLEVCHLGTPVALGKSRAPEADHPMLFVAPDPRADDTGTGRLLLTSRSHGATWASARLIFPLPDAGSADEAAGQLREFAARGSGSLPAGSRMTLFEVSHGAQGLYRAWLRFETFASRHVKTVKPSMLPVSAGSISKLGIEKHKIIFDAHLDGRQELQLSIGEDLLQWSLHASTPGIVTVSIAVQVDYFGPDRQEGEFLIQADDMKVQVPIWTPRNPVPRGKLTFREADQIHQKDGIFTVADIRRQQGVGVPVSIRVRDVGVATPGHFTKFSVRRGSEPDLEIRGARKELDLAQKRGEPTSLEDAAIQVTHASQIERLFQALHNRGLVCQAELERARRLRSDSASRKRVWDARLQKLKQELERVERSKGADHPDAMKVRDLIESFENDLSDSNR